MSLYGISDLHLSLDADKSMEIFSGWENYVERIKCNWIQAVESSDTVVIPGDVSWSTSLESAKTDFEFINNLPGEKIILKGNHDYWWTTMKKMENFIFENGFNSIKIINNNHYRYEQYGICGTRGWINENEEPADQKVLRREAGRLEASIQSALRDNLEPIIFLHYPVIYRNEVNVEMLEVLLKYGIKQCFYGHLHGRSTEYAINGESDNIKHKLISSDYLHFCPHKII